MIRALLFLALIAFTVCDHNDSTTHFEVILFRGQLPLLNARMSFDEITPQGIVLKNVVKTVGALKTPESWQTVVFHSGELNVILPLRSTGKWTLKKTAHLGVVLQSMFRTDEGDEFQVSLAFGLCSNNFQIEEFTYLLDKLEEKRIANSAELKKHLQEVKKQADINISSWNTMDDLKDDHVDNSQALADLKALNEQLIEQLKNLNQLIHTEEEKEFEQEKITSEACSMSKVKEAFVYSIRHECATYEEQVKVLNTELNSSHAFTNEERENYDKLHSDLINTLNSLAAYNAKSQVLTVHKGKHLQPEKLRPFFH